jgi:hypothetical protein
MGMAALAYARLGWPVLPLHNPVAGGCSCGAARCPSPAKHPRLRHGVTEATTDARTLAAWWSRWPEASIGLRTGKGGCGAWVLDVDPRHGGDASLAQLEAAHGPLPATPRVRTGSGGEHIFFAAGDATPGNRVGFLPGLDGRGENAYVVAAPSRHTSGRRYAWQPGAGPRQLSLAPVPAWLLEAGKRERATANGPRAAVANERRPPPLPVLHAPMPAPERARRYLARVEPAVSGAGGDAHTFAVAARVARGFDLSEAEALEAFSDWNDRCEPPWSERSLRRKIQNALRYGKQPLGERLGTRLRGAL